MLFGCLALVTAGCGGSGWMPYSRYRPPLRVSPPLLEAAPESSRNATRALRVIANTMRAPRFSTKDSIRFENVQFQLIIVNAGSPDAFTADQTVAEELNVLPDSSAKVREEVLRTPRLVSKVDRRRWEAAGRPSFASSTDRVGASFHRDLPPGAWSFTPEGRVVTFERVHELPTARRALDRELGRLLGTVGHPPPAALRLRQYGFLLAAAPLTPATRKAMLEAIASMPAVYTCSATFPAPSPDGDAFCANGNPTNTEILLDPKTGVAIVVCERLAKRNPLYPDTEVGGLVSSYTFSLQSLPPAHGRRPTQSGPSSPRRSE
jgi:hypothetical protein